jgi:hypothetical protein
MGTGVHRESRLLQKAIELNIPQVVLSRNWPGLNISTVSQDHVQQAEIAIDYLTRLGHKKIGFVANRTDTEYEWFDIRLSCYRRKIQKLNQKLIEVWIILDENGKDSARELFRNHPEITTIFAIHDGRAIEVMQGVLEAGLAIPDDISVIGVDGFKETPSGFPKLTTVGVSHFDIGYLATEILLKQVENENLFYGNLIVHSHLIERESCKSVETLQRRTGGSNKPSRLESENMIDYGHSRVWCRRRRLHATITMQSRQPWMKTMVWSLIPEGVYKIGSTLRISSNTRVKASPAAHLFFADGAGVNSQSFLITNKDHIDGNCNIHIEGGIWDGNTLNNPRGPDQPGSYTGAILNFNNVSGFSMKQMTF